MLFSCFCKKFTKLFYIYSPLIVALNVALQHIKVGQFTNSHSRKKLSQHGKLFFSGENLDLPNMYKVANYLFRF